MPDPTRDWRQEFLQDQQAQLQRCFERERRNRRNGAIAGAATGIAAVVITASMTRRAWFWHSCLLEALLCAVAGYLLVRLHGGLLKGILLFSGAFLLAFALRATGLDLSVVFAASDMRRGMATQGNFASLCVIVTCGGVLGHIVES